MRYRLVVEEKAIEQLKGLDPFQQRFVLSWLRKHLDGTENPRVWGKALSGSHTGAWCYRIGDYRVICRLQDDLCEIIAIEVGHRGKNIEPEEATAQVARLWRTQ